MTPRVIAIIAVRILALYLILSGLAIFPAFTKTGFSGFFLLDPQCLFIILGVILWLLAKPIANRIVSDETSSTKQPKSQFSKQQIEVIIFTVVGLLILVYGIPQLVSMIIYRKSVAPLVADPLIKIKEVASFKSALAYQIIEIVIGAYLLIFPHHFVKALENLRGKIVNLSKKAKSTSIK